MKTTGKNHAVRPTNSLHDLNSSPIPLLEDICKRGQSWNELAPIYGVTHADPPWKTSLHATFECLAAENVLPSLVRRQAEDQLSEVTYRQVPEPERRLIALAHTMIARGLVSEDALSRHMEAIRARLTTE